VVGSGGALWLGRAEGGRGVDGGRGSASKAEGRRRVRRVVT
jgi:hypothetical protein